MKKQLHFIQKISVLAIGIVCSFSSCAQEKKVENKKSSNTTQKTNRKMETATFANGCFWCTEAIFQQIKGVESIASGYMGGSVVNPTYKQVCTGETGHAECLQVVFDPAVISFEELLAAFWQSHDPTTLNRQGNDVGTQYRSAIFYHTEQQKILAQKYKKELDASGAYSKPIVTEISAASTFYKAEDYHQNYFNENGSQPYCSFVIQPKVEKFRKVFKDKLKTP